MSLSASPNQAALFLLYFFAGFAIASQWGGRILDKQGAHPALKLGTIVGAVGFALWAGELTDLSMHDQWPYAALAGAGIGFILAPASTDAVNWAIGLIGTFYIFTLVLGFGAAAIVGHQAITSQDSAGNAAAPQLAQAVGSHFGGETMGAILLALIASVAFATILSTVAGLVIASSSSLAHDFYNSVIRGGKATDNEQVRVARIAAAGIGLVAVVLAVFAQNLNVAFLVALAFAIAASANLPTILLSLFWKRFNTRGAVSGIYGGLIAAVGLVVFSPVVSGSETALIPHLDFAWFPMPNPALFSVPIGLVCAIVGTLTSKEQDFAKFAQLQVRALSGAGAEKASDH